MQHAMACKDAERSLDDLCGTIDHVKADERGIVARALCLVPLIGYVSLVCQISIRA